MKKNTSCHYPDFASCGCEPGTKCVFYPPEKKLEILPSPIKDLGVGKRDFFERPGKKKLTLFCIRITTILNYTSQCWTY